MKLALASTLALLLAGCSTMGDVGKNAGITCIQTPAWNGSPAHILHVNVDKGVAGTGGGNIVVDCGSAGKASVSDAGRAVSAPRVTP